MPFSQVRNLLFDLSNAGSHDAYPPITPNTHECKFLSCFLKNGFPGKFTAFCRKGTSPAPPFHTCPPSTVGAVSLHVPPESAIFSACMQHCCYSVRCKHADINTHQHKHTNTHRHKPTHYPQALEHTNTSTRAHRGAIRDSEGCFVGKTGRTLALKRQLFFLDCECPTWSVDCAWRRVFQLSGHTHDGAMTQVLIGAI